jgi:hypothetical protein
MSVTRGFRSFAHEHPATTYTAATSAPLPWRI